MYDHIFALLLQIYENDKLLHYIDGSDENNSSWMRFICCARHRGEQNLYAFQYNKEIYYRAFATIPAGEELLVWYEDTYPQYMGIPLNITDIGRQLDHSASKGSSKCTKHSSLQPVFSLTILNIDMSLSKKIRDALAVSIRMTVFPPENMSVVLHKEPT